MVPSLGPAAGDGRAILVKPLAAQAARHSHQPPGLLDRVLADRALHPFEHDAEGPAGSGRRRRKASGLTNRRMDSYRQTDLSDDRTDRRENLHGRPDDRASFRTDGRTDTQGRTGRKDAQAKGRKDVGRSFFCI